MKASKIPMTIKTAPRTVIQIYIGGSRHFATEACREFVIRNPLCVSVQETDFVYSYGLESGVCVTLVNYPRFPMRKKALLSLARKLGYHLMERLYQGSFMIQDDAKAIWFSRRKQ